MNKLGKTASIIVIVACLAALGLTFMVAKMKAEHLAQISQLHSDLDTTTAKLNKTQSTLKQTQADLTKTKSDLDQANANLQTAQTALNQKTQEATTLASQLSDASNQLQQATTKLTALQDSMDKIQAALKKNGFSDVDSLEKVTDKLLSLTEENKVLGDQLSTLHSENDRLQAEVTRLSTTPVGLRGHVSVAQNKWGFIVMDIGHDKLVQPNAEFLVYRDAKFVGKVQVVSVAAQNSIAQVLPEYQRHPPQPGDIVIH